MAIEVIVEISGSETEFDVEVGTSDTNVEVDIIYTGPRGLAAVVNQNGDLKAELMPGDIYTVTEFDTLKQNILGPVPLTITQKILD